MKQQKGGKIKIFVDLQPKQSQLLDIILNTEYRVIGYGGANGGAKSFAVRGINLILCSKDYSKPIKTLIFRRNSNDLLENHINPFFQEHPELRQNFNKSERMIYWSNGNTTKFGSADREDDIVDFEGKEYDYIFIDESTLTTQYMIEFLKTRNRSGVVLAKMILTMIPGFVSHNYHKRIFITKQYESYENPSDYYYLPARVWDNVVWVEAKLKQQRLGIGAYYTAWTEEQRKEYTLKHSDYAKNLSHLPEMKRRARLFGDWFVFEGQFFDFNSQVHIVRQEKYLKYHEIRDNFAVVGGLDYGTITVVSLVARSKNGDYIIFDELYHKAKKRSVKIADTVKFLKARGLKNIIVVGDTNMWIKDGFDIDVSKTAAYEYINAGVKLVKVSKSSPEKNKGYRIAANDLVNDLLHYETDKQGEVTKKPRLLVYERCTHFLSNFPSLIVDKNNPEDIANGQEDHCYDSAKYGILYLRKPRKKKKDDLPLFLQEMQEKTKQKANDFMSV